LKLENILISSAVVTLIFISFTTLFNEGIEQYGINGYNDQGLKSFNESLYKIENSTNQLSEGLARLSSGNLLDIIGGIFQSSVGVFNTFLGGIFVVSDVFQQGVGVLPLGSLSDIWVGTAGVIILVLLIVGVFLRFVNKG